ncbi:MAG: OmpA family protein [Bacteroides sp.]|nr:OmpA family protein [Bacteroides sp.]
MKRTIIFAACAIAASSLWARMPEASDVTITDITAARDGSNLNLAFNLDLSKMPKGINTETRLIPVVKAGNDSIRLESVTIAGRNRMIQAQRTGAVKSDATKYYRSGKVKDIPYSTTIEYQSWMDNANIDLVVENLGCCESRKTVADRPLARLNMGERPIDMTLEYVTPVEERVKMRNARGEAYIDFVVNTTNIRPDYRNNPRELDKIRATIDSVKSDPDTKITSLTISGYASPEGSYANNERLAKGRTQALADYVQKLYTFPKNIMKTFWVAEDWAGLRRFVENSEMVKKDAILAVIDSNLAPDTKDHKLASDFPVDYRFMLTNWYPALRHSDYTVEYEVRNYTDPAEIARVFKKNPSNLSLRELFIYAETLDPKSAEYADVFQTAAKMYPEDETANLNAANCAIMRGDYQEATAYLAKAGDTPQATYARGVLAAKTGDYAKATQLFNKAGEMGIDISDARRVLERATAPDVVIF